MVWGLSLRALLQLSKVVQLNQFENLLADQEAIDKKLNGALVMDDEEAFFIDNTIRKIIFTDIKLLILNKKYQYLMT